MSVLALLAPAALPDLDVGGEMLKVLLSLGGIVALILAAGWLSRRLQAGTHTGGPRIRCVESFSVGARERVLLLDADGKRLLVGAGPGGLRTLHVYEGAAPVDEAPAPAAPNFGELLNRWKRRP